ncbi:acyltransferase [Paenibacillus sp. 481]|uniref:acyltransferase n=1 Tax=Paenibacillus sp. 481 TaxID=2835869 RepID=UPI001E42466A|nr:acyltransferase [Paenibacillus sp. 481]UHA71662.1 N-acetyltransferase [Paenibacillus sp. 481]
MKYYKHPQSLVETDNIGANSRVWAFAHILPGAVLGENCNVNDHTFIENDVVLGDNVTVKSGVYIWDGVRIKDNVFIGPNVTFTNDLRPRSKQYPDQFLETIVEEWASIGANSTIIAGITIGKYAMIGAGSVVTKNVPNNTLWFGNPAKFVSYICNCGEKLSSDLVCSKCNKEYEHKNCILGEKND